MSDYIEIAKEITADLSYIDFRNSLGMERAEKMIRKALHKVMQEKWISVEDRLPKEGYDVLLVYEFNHKRHIAIDALYKNNFRSTICNGYSPVYWMSLPEPPKEGF